MNWYFENKKFQGRAVKKEDRDGHVEADNSRISNDMMGRPKQENENLTFHPIFTPLIDTISGTISSAIGRPTKNK